MAIIGSLRERFHKQHEQDKEYSGTGQLPKQEEKPEPSWRERRAEKQYEKQAEKEEQAGRVAIERKQKQVRKLYKAQKIAEVRTLREELNERTKMAKERTTALRHPTYVKAKEAIKEKGKEYGSKAYRAGYETKEKAKKFAVERVKEFDKSAGTTYIGAYSRGQSTARIRQRQDPRRGTARARSTQSQMRPVTAPTTYSLSERVAGESYRPSMFQSDVTRQGELRQPVIEQKPQQDFLAGLGTGISAQKDYFGGGNKMTIGSTKRNGSTGLGLGLSKQKGDYFGLGTKKKGVLQTTKKKTVRYY